MDKLNKTLPSQSSKIKTPQSKGNIPSSSRKLLPSKKKEKKLKAKENFNVKNTVFGECDETMGVTGNFLPDLDVVQEDIAYGRLMRPFIGDRLVEEKSKENIPSTSRKLLPSKEEKLKAKKIINVNDTVIGECDEIMCETENFMPDLEAVQREIAYGRFLRSLLEDCLVEEKIKKEETEMDIQMCQLATRFEETVAQVDQTNRRLKDINFVVEQKRLLDLKNQDCSEFYEITENSKVENHLSDLKKAEEPYLDKLETKNVDFGYNKESGHKQLLDAVNEATEGLDEIKKKSKLDFNKFKEYEKSNQTLNDLEKDKFDIESLKSEFEMKFPKFSEKLLNDVSEKISSTIDSDSFDDDSISTLF